MILGIDPGLEGGAVLVEPGTAPLVVRGAWHWRPHRGAYVLRGVTPQDGVRLASLHDVGVAIARDCADVAPDGWRVLLEGLFLHDTSRAARILTLAEAAGEVLGPLRSRGVIERPNAARWRGKVLRLKGGTDADVAEAYAVRCVPVLARPPGLGALADVGHVAEALCLAYYGAVVDAA